MPIFSFAIVVDIFSHGSSQKPKLGYNSSALTCYSVINETGNRIRVLEVQISFLVSISSGLK